MRTLALAAAVAALAVLAPAAQAQTCGPLKRAFSLDLSPGPGGGPRFGVPVTVNGTPRTLLLNTAGEITRIGRNVITQLGLTPRSQGTLLGMNGSVTNAHRIMVDLGIGPVTVKQGEYLVDENPGRFDGVFSPDVMQHYDIEFDFTARKLNYFLTDHCDGQVIYWPNSGATNVPFRGWVEHADHPFMTIPVSIDGHEVFATVNTGLAETTLEANTAHQLFNLSPDSTGAVPMGTMDGNPAHKVFGWTFKTLAIGGVSISNPRISVIPDLLGTKSNDTLDADSHVRRSTDNKEPTIRLGMDMLRRLHLYVAAKEQKLYVTLAADQAPGGTAPGGR